MEKDIKNIETRFRAYQLGDAGSSFSYYANGHFTLIEGRFNSKSINSVKQELSACGKSKPDTLHITSWDNDHCNDSELEFLLKHHPPTRIEYPGYGPESACAKLCLRLIVDYERAQAEKAQKVRIQRVDPEYVNSLKTLQGLEYRDIVYHPKNLYDNGNDNSTVKLFRTGVFNVLSLGDVMHVNIASMLRRCPTLRRETDVMILAHHGADNGFTTKKLLEEINPRVAICTSNWGNQYDHPRQSIRDLLSAQGIPLYTTKCGDVLIQSTGGHTVDYKVIDFMEDGKSIRDRDPYRSRKAKYLMMNADSRRNRINRPNKGPR